MYLLTNKALEKREQDAWAKGNSDATKAWQNEFEQQAKEYKQNKKAMYVKLAAIITKYVSETKPSMLKKDIINNFELMASELLDAIDLLKEE